jgi:hypothetical protein
MDAGYRDPTFPIQAHSDGARDSEGASTQEIGDLDPSKFTQTQQTERVYPDVESCARQHLRNDHNVEGGGKNDTASK